MRVSTKALATVSGLLFFASCVTPPPIVGASRSASYRTSEPRGEPRGVRRGTPRPLAAPAFQQERRDPWNSAEPEGYADDYVDDSELRVAAAGSAPSSWTGTTRRSTQWEERRGEGRFDDGRFATPRPSDRGGTVVPASYSPEPLAQSGRYDNRYNDRFDEVPAPNERGDYSTRPSGRVSFLFGGRQLDDEGFEGSDDLFAFGVEFSQVPDLGEVGFEFGFGFGANRENNVSSSVGTVDLERDMAEIYAGLRAEFGQSNVRPYIGGGATLINVSDRVSQGFLRSTDDDTAVGGYLHGGVQVDLNSSFFIGADFRYVFGSPVELFDQRIDTDYGQLAFTIGTSL